MSGEQPYGHQVGGTLERLLAELNATGNSVTGSEADSFSATTQALGAMITAESVEPIEYPHTYAAAGGKLLIPVAFGPVIGPEGTYFIPSMTKPKITVNGAEIGVNHSQYRLLAFMGHPDRIDKLQGYRSLMTLVTSKNISSPQNRKVEQVNERVAEIRQKFGDDDELRHPVSGVLRRYENGLMLVSSLKIPPVRPIS